MLNVKIRFIFRPTVMMSNVIEQAEEATGGVKQGVLKNFENFTGKQLCWSLFLIKLQGGGLQLY